MTAYNTGDSPVLIDNVGRTLGGGEWGTVDTTADAVKLAVSANRLRLFTGGFPEGVQLAPQAAEAHATTDEVGRRADALGGLDRDSLAAIASDAGLIGRGEVPYKADLLALLAPALAVSVPSSSASAPDPVEVGPSEEPAPEPDGAEPDPSTDTDGAEGGAATTDGEA